jgi:hypothetical protein
VISDTEADIGSNLRWGCAAAGKPRPMVHWLRNGEPLASQVGNLGFLLHTSTLLGQSMCQTVVLGASSHPRVTQPTGWSTG